MPFNDIICVIQQIAEIISNKPLCSHAMLHYHTYSCSTQYTSGVGVAMGVKHFVQFLVGGGEGQIVLDCSWGVTFYHLLSHSYLPQPTP